MVANHRAMMGAQGWDPQGPGVYQNPGGYAGVPLEYHSGGGGGAPMG